MDQREIVIRNYINAYNCFDTQGMTTDFTDNIVFRNISGGQENLVLSGKAAFSAQAEQTKNLFSSRTQTLKSIKHQPEQSEVTIGYHAILAVDLPNGMKKGDELNLEGRSVFKFSGNLISALTDIS